jgi:hypothetical protein
MKTNVVFVLATSASLLACAHDRESKSAQSSTQSDQRSAQSPQSSMQAPQSSAQSAQPGSSREGKQTIDCPPTALAKAEESLPSSSPVGTPSGAGTGSGAEAVPGKGQVERVEGDIKEIDSSRTARGIEVSGVKLWVEPTTAVLVDCQKASVADLKQGTPVKAMYEAKDGRNIAKVIEAQRR